MPWPVTAEMAWNSSFLRLTWAASFTTPTVRLLFPSSRAHAKLPVDQTLDVAGAVNEMNDLNSVSLCQVEY